MATKERLCRYCKIEKPESSFNVMRTKLKVYLKWQCKDCANAHTRAYNRRNNGLGYRKLYKKWKAAHKHYASLYLKKFPDRMRAYGRVRYAIKTGKLKKLPCEVCGSPDTEGHHDDYSKPLDVRWLCPFHHKEYHIKYLKNDKPKA